MICLVLSGCIGQQLGLGLDNSACGNGLMTDVSNDRWLSVDEVAAYLGVKRDTIYKWIVRKNLPAHKVGSLWKLRREEVDEWVTSGRDSDARDVNKPR